MKKLLILSTLLSAILTQQAFAKSQHQISVEASRFDVDQTFGDATYLGSDDAILATIGYGYKFQFKNNLFVRPSIFYTIGDVEMKDTDGLNGKSTFNPEFSLEADFGYNITDKFALFGTAGLMTASMERQDPILAYRDEAKDVGFIVGAGAEYQVIDNLSVSLKYQFSKVDFGVENANEDWEVESNTIRLGLSYNF
jgi:opacity protein-like surface antigen